MTCEKNAEVTGAPATIHVATGRPVLVAFQNNNLQEVALEFKQQFSGRTIAVLGDDRHLPEPQGGFVHAERDKAIAMAKVGRREDGVSAVQGAEKGGNLSTMQTCIGSEG